jgi:hypothetical protein
MPIIQNSWVDALTVFSILLLYVFWNPNELIPAYWTNAIHYLIALAKVIKLVQIGIVILQQYQPHHQ